MPKKTAPFTETEEQNLAHQWTMWEADKKFSDEWDQIMQRLIAERLDRTAFIDARMTALRDWERRRKLAQAKIHYQFDTGRRRHHLIAQDTVVVIDRIKAQIAMKAAAERLKKRIEEEQATTYDDDDFA